MNITVIGASRGTGAQTVRQAEARGHRVTAMSRRPPQSQSQTQTGSQVQWVGGDALDPEAVAVAVRGADAVVVTVGAPARDSSGLRARATSVVLRAMKTHGVRRLVLQSSLGVGESVGQLPWVTRHVVAPTLLRRAFADHERQEQLVRESDVEWTLVRPTHLRDGFGEYVVAEDGVLVTGSVARSAVAELLVTEASRQGSAGRVLAVAGSSRGPVAGVPRRGSLLDSDG